MRKEIVIKADGRDLILYWFKDPDESTTASEDASAQDRQPQADKQRREIRLITDN